MSDSNGHANGKPGRNGKPAHNGKPKKPATKSAKKPPKKTAKKPPRKKGKRHATPAEMELRIDATVELLRKGYLKHQIKKALREKFDLCNSSIEKTLSRAKAVLREDTGQTTEDLRSDAYAYYNAILTDPQAPLHLKIKARTRLDKILGIEQHNVNVNLGWQRKVKDAGMDPAEFQDAMVSILRERMAKEAGAGD